MKISPKFGNEPAIVATCNPQKIIISSEIPPALREVNVEYTLKVKLYQSLNNVDANIIDQAIDNAGIGRFIEPLREAPDNDSIKSLLATAICFEMECLGVKANFNAILDCIRNA